MEQFIVSYAFICACIHACLRARVSAHSEHTFQYARHNSKIIQWPTFSFSYKLGYLFIFLWSMILVIIYFIFLYIRRSTYVLVTLFRKNKKLLFCRFAGFLIIFFFLSVTALKLLLDFISSRWSVIERLFFGYPINKQQTISFFWLA